MHADLPGVTTRAHLPRVAQRRKCGNTETTLLDDDPMLLKVLRLVPFGVGSGIALGETLDACFPSTFGAN